MHVVSRNVSSRFSKKIEANASEFLEDVEEIYPGYWWSLMSHTYITVKVLS